MGPFHIRESLDPFCSFGLSSRIDGSETTSEASKQITDGRSDRGVVDRGLIEDSLRLRLDAFSTGVAPVLSLIDARFDELGMSGVRLRGPQPALIA